jgi:thiamine pyrophosphokinase
LECRGVTTTGFRWNVSGETLAFGKLVSTSNEFDRKTEIAEVTNPETPLLFTLQMRQEH